MTVCLGEDTVVGFIEHRLDSRRADRAMEHLAMCAECRNVVIAVRRAGIVVPTEVLAPEPTDVDAPLPRGTRIGRYEIVSLLGRGGMSSVYRAKDPHLDRDVALKLVESSEEHVRVRMMREAQALAKLSHPHVVQIHDVGCVADEVFLAIELVDGVTLRTWLAERPRAARDILRVFRAAGEGLAAAHRVGVVHRDFKPENVMIGADGRVRVLDFGLASMLPSLPAIRPVASHAPTAHATTRTGTVLGTPAYMSPEQDAGLEIGAASDQFSFCVALYEALFGAPPYRGTSHDELARSRAQGEVVAPPPTRGVTRRIRRAVLVGLRPDPVERHRDVDALLADLRPRRWAVRAIAAAIVVGLAIGGAATSLAWSGERATSCNVVAAESATVWNAARRDELAARFARVHPRGAQIERAVAAAVDRWTADWIAVRTATCELSQHPDGEPPIAERLDCLKRRLIELDRTLAVLTTTTDASLVEHAAEGVGRIGSASECARLTSPWPSERDVEAAKPIVSVMTQERSAQDLGHFDEAVALARSAVEMARRIRSPELAHALKALGDVHSARGELDDARATYRDAAIAAAEAHDDGLVAEVWIALMALSSYDHKFDDTARAALSAADVAIRRLPADDARRPLFDVESGSFLALQGKFADAVPALERGISAYERLGAANYVQEIANAENSLGLVYMEQGEWSKAAECFGRFEAAFESYGPDWRGGALTNRALLASYQERDTEAEALMLQALALYEQLGPTNPLVGEGEYNLGELYARSNRCQRAAPHLARARQVFTMVHGDASPMLVAIEIEQGRCRLARDPRAVAAALTKARATALAQPATVRELPELDFVLAQALAGSGDLGHARDVARTARSEFMAIGAGTAARVRAVDRWLTRN
jgi:tetratricopeptide (TPR) repeat protein